MLISSSNLIICRHLLGKPKTHLSLAKTILHHSLRRSSAASANNLPEIPKEKAVIRKKTDPVAQEKLKRIHVEYHAIESSNFNDQTLWYPIYRFPYVVSFKYLIKAKVYITIFSILIVAKQLGNFLIDPMHTNLFQPILLSSITLSGILFIGNFCRKLVCQVYVTEDQYFVRLARLTFFGNRLDMVLPRSAIFPLTETNTGPTKSFLNIHTIKPKNVSLNYDYYEFYDEIFKITLKFGGILDGNKFKNLFGDILKIKIQ